MVVWSGFGFLSAAALIAGLVSGIAVGDVMGVSQNYAAAAGVLAGAAANWLIWQKLNRSARNSEQPAGAAVLRGHTLFWLPMQYWSLIAAVIAAGLASAPTTSGMSHGKPLELERKAGL